MNESRKLYSCHCLFDICCISKHYNESFKEIGTRVSEYRSKIYTLFVETIMKVKLIKCILTSFNKNSMRGSCQAKMSFEKHKGKFPCCYNYYLTGLISVINICTQCKIFLVSLSDFQLKKIVIAKKICL